MSIAEQLRCSTIEATALTSRSRERSESSQKTHELPPSLDRDILQLPVFFRHEKDVTVTYIDGRFYLAISASNVDDESDWKMYSFTSPDLNGQWKDNGFINIEGEQSPRLCAAGITADSGYYRMLIQTECFGSGGTIDYAESVDGINFRTRRTILSAEQDLGTGIYDAEPAFITRRDGQKENYFTFTAVKEYQNGQAKNGAIYLAKINHDWSGSEVVGKIFDEYDIPPHLPTAHGGEWVPEGGKMLQLNLPMPGKGLNDKILFYGTCFTDSNPGNRQRGFLAFADEIDGKYTFLGTLPPANSSEGETGHGTLIDDDINGRVQIIHQARGKSGTWHIERTSYSKTELANLIQNKQNNIQ